MKIALALILAGLSSAAFAVNAKKSVPSDGLLQTYFGADAASGAPVIETPASAPAAASAQALTRPGDAGKWSCTASAWTSRGRLDESNYPFEDTEEKAEAAAIRACNRRYMRWDCKILTPAACHVVQP